ncbi:MAG: hypothetical protein QMC94_00440 [Anaerosomatales bacterium]|nr:hypothetical protein [Anaerosomatales bacterium]
MGPERTRDVAGAAPRAKKAAVRAGVAAAVLAAIGASALALMPEPLKAVPSAAEGAGTVQLYYEAAFPTPGDQPLERPVSVASLRSRIFVADSVAGVVRVFDERGVPESIVGSGTLVAPTYVACDPQTDRVYVTDRKLGALFWFVPGESELRRLEPRWPRESGAATRSAEATSWAPLGVAAGEDGTVWVTDVSARHRVLALDASGRVAQEIGGPGSHSQVVVALDYPNDVALVGHELWVSDSNHGRVVVFDESGRYLRAMSLGGLVRGLAPIPAASGEVTAVAGVDTLGNDIVLWNVRGEELGRFGEPGTIAGRLQIPNDVAVSADGSRLFVADTGNRRIQVWRVEWESADAPARRLFGSDASNRAPYVGVALVSFASALVLAVVAVSLWRRARLVGQDGPPEDGAEVLE